MNSNCAFEQKVRMLKEFSLGFIVQQNRSILRDGICIICMMEYTGELHLSDRVNT